MTEPIHAGPYLGLVDLTCRDVARRWEGFVELNDLIQEAMVWWYGPGQKYLPAYTTEDENYVRLRRSIWRHVARFAEAEKAACSGYEPVDQYTYTPAVVLRVLPHAFDPTFDGHGNETGYDRGPRAHGNLAEGGDLLASWADVRRAVRALPEDDQALLRIADTLHYDWERVSSYTQTLPDSCRRRHARICRRLARWLNEYTDPVEATA